MANVHVNLKEEVDDSYDIVIEPGCLLAIAKDLKDRPLAYRHAIITDSNVKPFYGESLLKDLREHGLNADIFYFPAGEEHKNRETKACVEDEMQRGGYGRDSVIIALGGGVVGDLAGFVAATYNRGVPFIQVPTTTMAQADSSVGGKVAIDTPQGKNLVGAFYQPRRVYIDPYALRTLTAERVADGMAEIAKKAMILDREFFESLYENSDAIRRLEPETMVRTLLRACQLKAGIVEKDPTEKGLRAILNYGHTIGHGVEKVMNYQMPHGNCVSIGIRYAGEISLKRGMLSLEDHERCVRLLEKFSLPTDLPDLDKEELVKAMRADKKVERGEINFILLNGIGEVATENGRYKIPVSEEELFEIL